ncbi:hypothetical protein, partial [Leifsonia aquatica]|uniref:hypothetical protein n=1 Tax=Leifsonia aquatica TaxID=144185 RepID=UPI001B7F989A
MAIVLSFGSESFRARPEEHTFIVELTQHLLRKWGDPIDWAHDSGRPDRPDSTRRPPAGQRQHPRGRP